MNTGWYERTGMRETMICNQADIEIFNRQCAALEKHIPNLKKLDKLEDVDGSTIQRYSIDGKRVNVHNRIDDDEVVIRTDLDVNIDGFFA